MSQNGGGTTDNWKEVRKRSVLALPKEVVRLITEVKRNDPRSKSQLISVLHRLQGIEGHLGPDQLQAVAQLLGVPAAKVTGVASFYHYFRLLPRGKYMISVCMGTACYVKGAEDVRRAVSEILGIAEGETSADKLFSLHGSRCVGTCGLAPVVMVNDEVHAKMTPSQVPGLIEHYRSLGTRATAG